MDAVAGPGEPDERASSGRVGATARPDGGRARLAADPSAVAGRGLVSSAAAAPRPCLPRGLAPPGHRDRDVDEERGEQAREDPLVEQEREQPADERARSP